MLTSFIKGNTQKLSLSRVNRLCYWTAVKWKWSTLDITTVWDLITTQIQGYW